MVPKNIDNVLQYYKQQSKANSFYLYSLISMQNLSSSINAETSLVGSRKIRLHYRCAKNVWACVTIALCKIVVADQTSLLSARSLSQLQVVL